MCSINVHTTIYLLITLASFSKVFANPKKHIEYITQEYFSGESLLFIYWSNVSIEFRLQLTEYWFSSEIVTVETCNCDFVTDDIIWERSYVKNIIVLFGDMVPKSRDIKKIKQCLSWNARSKVLAIVNNSKTIAAGILKKFWTVTKAMNVTVMTLTKSSVKYYTSYPYQSFKIVGLNQNELFPKKPLDNLHGTILKQATVSVVPYVLRSLVPRVYHDGLEIRIIKYLSKKLNFQTRIIRPPKGENHFVVLSKDKRKTTGSIGLLDRCEADIAAHGLQIRLDTYRLADYTAIHTIDSMAWVVPIRPFTFNWGSIIFVFQNDLWIGLFISFLLISGTLYLIIKYEFNSPLTSYDFSDAFFQTFGIHLLVSINFSRDSQVYRLFLFTISYYTITVVAMYQSSLITYLTTRGSRDQFKIIEEAVDDGKIGYLFLSNKPLYNVTDHELWNKILRPGRHEFLNDFPTILSLVAVNKTGFTMVMKSAVHFEVNKNFLDENHKPMVRVLPEIYLPYLATIMTSRGHPLRELIRDNIMRLLETGILTHWMRDIVLKNLKMYGRAKSSDSGPMALSLEQLKGAFYILPVLFVVAGVVFIFEVICHWWSGGVKYKRNDRLFKREIENV